MSDSDIADFDNYRYLRDHEGEITSMPAQNSDDMVIPVLDCDSFQLVRLHIFQGADNADRVDAFEAEMATVAKLDERLVSAPIKWGIDPGENKIFYLNPFLEGEPLSDYLDRAGNLTVGIASLWLFPFVNIAEQLKEKTPHIRLGNLFVARNLVSNLPELHLTEFTSWLDPNAPVTRSIDFYLGQIFLAMISGIGKRDFDEASLPKQFHHLSASHQETILKSLASKPGENEAAFFELIRDLAKTSTFEIPDLPRSTLQDWFQSEINHLSEALVLDPDQEPVDDINDSFAIQGEYDGLPCAIQVLPGELSIDRDWFFAQHFKTIDRIGRNAANQLAAYESVVNNSITTITEEEPEGLHLDEIFRARGSFGFDNVAAMTNRLSSAIDGLEATSGALTVWHLPATSIYLALGTHSVEDFAKALDYEGPDLWSRISFRLRLHLTSVDLLTGVDIPESIRPMADKLLREDAHIRRAAVLLPLVTRALTGRNMDWQEPINIQDDSIPAGVAELLETTRETLLNDPSDLDKDFVSNINSFVKKWDPQANASASDDLPDHDKDGEFKAILSDRLGTERIDIATPQFNDDDTDTLHLELEALDENTDDTPEVVDTYQSGDTYDPADLEKEKASKEEREAKKEAIQRRIEEREHERKIASRQMLGLDTEIEPPKPPRKGWLGWLYIAVAALVLGIVTAIFLDNKATTDTGTKEVVEKVSFPIDQYDVVTPEVDPFTDLVPSVPKSIPQRPASIAAKVDDMAVAISRSKNATQRRHYNDAVEYALQAIKLSPESTSAANQLEAVLKNWSRSGINLPTQTDDTKSAHVLAEYHIKGVGRTVADRGIPEGLYYLMNAANNGDTQAMRILGLIFGQGKLVPKSPPLAMKWLKKAAVAGDEEAQFYFGESSIFGTMIPTNDEGFALLVKASTRRHPRALLFRGYCHLKGWGVEQDEEKGFLHISDAAARGSIEAVYQMGLCQVNGVGTDKNENSAMIAFKSAAELGYVPSMHDYAQCLINGVGTPPSYEQGVSWMKKAASIGYSKAEKWCVRHEVSFKDNQNQTSEG